MHASALQFSLSLHDNIVVLLVLLNALSEYSSSAWEEMYQSWVVNNGIVSRVPNLDAEKKVKCLVNGENYPRKEK